MLRIILLLVFSAFGFIACTTASEVLTNTAVSDSISKKKVFQLGLSLHLNGASNVLTNSSFQGQVSQLGTIGYGLGLEVRYNRRRYITLVGQLFAGQRSRPFFKSIPLNEICKDSYEVSSSRDLSLIHYHILKRFHVGYGINGSRKGLSRKTIIDDDNIRMDGVNNNSLGIVGSVKYKIWRSCYATFNYLPTFYELTDTGSKYQHVISIGLIGSFSYKFDAK